VRRSSQIPRTSKAALPDAYPTTIAREARVANETPTDPENPERVRFFGKRRGLNVALTLLTFGLWLLIPLTIWLWRTGRRRGASVVGGVVGLLVLVIAIGATTSGGSSRGPTASEKTSTTVEQAATDTTPAVAVAAAPTRASAVTARERTWLRSLTPLLHDTGTFVTKISQLSTNTAILVRGSSAQLQLVVALAGLRECTPTLKEAGPAPTKRLRPFRAALGAACAAYGKSAVLIARGIDNLNSSTIGQAAREMQLGTTYIHTANRVLLNIRRSAD
jgi:hypothetical protein